MARECIGYKTIVIDDPHLTPIELFAKLDDEVMEFLQDGWGLHGDSLLMTEGVVAQTLVKYITTI